ncbi:MAG: MerR family DNA-binding protein [Acidobacteria bacterium]|nr:MerR family DNA-binding protein [Acidobacteriota bacterium]
MSGEAGNYRLYNERALDRLRFIRAAQINGFTLEDVVTLPDFRDGRTSPCREVQTLIEARLADLEQPVEQMRHVQAVLKSALAVCRKAEHNGRCAVMDDLNQASSERSPGVRRRAPKKR